MNKRQHTRHIWTVNSRDHMTQVGAGIGSLQYILLAAIQVDFMILTFDSKYKAGIWKCLHAIGNYCDKK